MSKLTKQQSELHAQSCALLQKDILSHEERLFVLEHWQESANHVSNIFGAFFTPPGLARDFSIEVPGGRVLDLCAGIGALAFATYHRNAWTRDLPKITCIEMNADYVAVGRKILPEATWLVADVFDLPASLTGFDCAIANPPFGRFRHSGKAPRYTGREFEYEAIDIASDRADYGVFLIPQSSSPFRYSGRREFEETPPEKYKRFSRETSIELECNCGIDTSYYASEWRGVSIATEIVLADFQEARSRRQTPKAGQQSALFPFSNQWVTNVNNLGL